MKRRRLMRRFRNPRLVSRLSDLSVKFGRILLGKAPSDSGTNFFALGGYSLLAVQVCSRLRGKVPVILSLSDFFENPTIKQQADLVRKRLAAFQARESVGA